jgi:hypothetical protein
VSARKTPRYKAWSEVVDAREIGAMPVRARLVFRTSSCAVVLESLTDEGDDGEELYRVSSLEEFMVDVGEAMGFDPMIA